MSWVQVLPQSELPEGARRVVKIAEQEVLLIHEQGQIYAMSSRCPHMKAPLVKGKVEHDAIICPWHRSAFDLHTGDAKAWTPWPPGVGKMLGAIAREKALPVFPTKVEDGHIWINVGEETK